MTGSTAAGDDHLTSLARRHYLKQIEKFLPRAGNREYWGRHGTTPVMYKSLVQDYASGDPKGKHGGPLMAGLARPQGTLVIAAFLRQPKRQQHIPRSPHEAAGAR